MYPVFNTVVAIFTAFQEPSPSAQTCPLCKAVCEIRLLTSDCLGENFDRVSPQVVSNRPVWGVVDRHPDGPPKGDGLFRNLCQRLMDIGLLRQGGVEVDAKNFLDPDESGNEDRRGYRPLGHDDGVGPESGRAVLRDKRAAAHLSCRIFRRRALGLAPHRDHFGENRKRDLLRRDGGDVEPGGRLDRG